MLIFFTTTWILLCFIDAGIGRESVQIISVNNGGKLGFWGPIDKCPEGYRARGFTIKVEKRQYFADDTALNGIKIFCAPNGSSPDQYGKTSSQGRWGEWTPSLWCPGYLVAFSLRVEPVQGKRDDTAANNIKFLCSTGVVMETEGLNWGSYGPWSAKCVSGICGIQTRVQDDQGSFRDDTALNDVQFICC